ncbi:hypothetical protein DPMN_023500 [Dreissena polymorpha]|uniref:Uncharacterized protein n=1 Tax=Dreissena polymorpha TaxID=45954 RepID=A0A9D4LPS9_DREPO|nr:hypothetical protein DPMN_023500 [Dreissena polymorpha]
MKSQSLPLEFRKNAFLALVRSKLEYASVVWDPFHQTDIDRLEGVQRSAARFKPETTAPDSLVVSQKC